MLPHVSTPPSDPIARELAAMRAELQQLLADNRALQERLARSEQARADLAAQAAHLIHLLGELRKDPRPVQSPQA